jgi:hypothetical protein
MCNHSQQIAHAHASTVEVAWRVHIPPLGDDSKQVIGINY